MRKDTDTHPLPDTWTLYAHSQADSMTYHVSYDRITTVATCEDWGRFWNHIPHGLVGTHDRDVHVRGRRVQTWSYFKNETQPEWEHPDNHNGLTFVCRLHGDEARRAWQTLLVECTRGAAPSAMVGIQVTQKPSRRQSPFVRCDAWFSAGATSAAAKAWLKEATQLDFAASVREMRTKHA